MSANDLYLTTEEDLTTVAEAIRTRGGTSEALEYPDGFASAIAAIPGNVEVQEKDVNFYDYDGTLLYSYTKAQALLLSALPENPSHEGLTAQGWNWTLAEIQAELTTYPDQFIQVGQLYITTSGKTEIDIVLDDSNYLSPYLKYGLTRTLVIEWGDGNQDTVSGSGTGKKIQHTYSTTGNYTIKLQSEGRYSLYNSDEDYAAILVPGTSGDQEKSRIYSKSVRHIRIGNNLEIPGYSFVNLPKLQTITIPNNLKPYSGTSTLKSFYNSTELKCFIAPNSDNFTELSTGEFHYCTGLKVVSISKKITSLGVNTFQYCTSLNKIGIPSSITQIGNYAFAYCCSLEELYIPGASSVGNYCAYNDYRLKKLTIPNLSGDIKTYSFANCYGLNNVPMSNNAENINTYAYSYCKSNERIVLPNTIKTISDYAFQYNSSVLGSVTIPALVTSIGRYAFAYDVGIAEYHVLPTTPPTLGNNAFMGTNAIIYVPANSLSNYLTAWSGYASIIQAEPA